MKKVLILEDEVSIRSFVVINLKRAGYEVVEAGTGEEALELLKANPAAADFYGYPLDTLRRMNIAQLNQLSVEEVRAEMALADQQQRRYFNFRHRLASGEVREVEVHSGPVLLRGRRLLYSIIHDITARRRAEEQLRLSAKVFEGASEGIVIQASDLGKFKTIFQIVAILGLLLHYDYNWFFGIQHPLLQVNMHNVGMFYLWIATLLTVWSGVDYFYKLRRIFLEDER